MCWRLPCMAGCERLGTLWRVVASPSESHSVTQDSTSLNGTLHLGEAAIRYGFKSSSLGERDLPIASDPAKIAADRDQEWSEPTEPCKFLQEVESLSD